MSKIARYKFNQLREGQTYRMLDAAGEVMEYSYTIKDGLLWSYKKNQPSAISFQDVLGKEFVEYEVPLYFNEAMELLYDSSPGTKYKSVLDANVYLVKNELGDIVLEAPDHTKILLTTKWQKV